MYCLVATVFLHLCLLCAVHSRKSAVYDTSFAYLEVYNNNNGKSQTFCVNYEQSLTRPIASSQTTANKLGLGWWGGEEGNVNVCVKNESLSFNNKAVALNYRLDRSSGSCATPYMLTNTSFKGALQFEVNELLSQNASAGIILVEKGRNFVTKWSDYLFSDFFDPDFNLSTPLPTFFMYKSVFFNELLNLSTDGKGKDLTLLFYRPPSPAWDISMLIVWSVAVFCVGVGGYWAGHRKMCEEQSSVTRKVDQVAPTKTNEDTRGPENLSNEQLTAPINCFFIIIIMVVVVGVLMLGFYFRDVMVQIFNVLLAVVGTFSAHRCLSALFGSLFRCGHCRICISMNDVTRSIFRRDLFNCECCSERPRVASLLIFAFSASFCLTWLFIRRNPYAFIMLDSINITLCLHVLKGIRFPNLKWLTVLLGCMFVYDMFMVFGTPFLTKNGCSVMIEVAAGTDCSKNLGYPVAPVNSNIPEKFPMLFQIPRLSDPMMPCVDLEVEKEYHPVILGLGDVIVPGYLISFCFTVDFAVKTRHLYGIVSILGYACGLFATFFALTLMETAQPALIYLIPFTLLPVLILALIRKELRLLWTGGFPPITASNGNTYRSTAESYDGVETAATTTPFPSNEASHATV